MQLMQLLHNFFHKESSNLHLFTFNNLFKVSETLIRTNKLNITHLGRNLSNKNKTRSNIKKVDRLIGNKCLQRESINFYKLINGFLIQQNSSPWIHIDWSCICFRTKLYLLRASLSMSGRSIVLYEECHLKKYENNHSTHKKFLDNLKSMLPASVKPIIITDAGFRAIWFRYILKLGWDFVGRIRNTNCILLDSNATWQLSKDLYKQGTKTPTFLGQGLLTKDEKLRINFVIYKTKNKNRHKLNKMNKPCHNVMSRRYSQSTKEPWLLVTSRIHSNVAIETVNIYRQRMRIEENFRDTKCTRYGFGLKESLTRSIDRMKILLLIACIATFACWIAAILTKKLGFDADFQIQSSKFKKALSMVYLGKESLKRGLRIKKEQFQYAIKLLLELITKTQQEEQSYA